MAKKEVKTNKDNKKESKNKKSFFKGFKAELKKVIWPSPKQLVNNTIAVIVIVLITAAIVFVLDLTFETINSRGINKIKEVIGTSNETENTTSEDNTTNEEATDENAGAEEGTENDTISEEGQETENTENNENVENNTENKAE